MINVLQNMLLIEDPSVFRLYQELIKIANYFVAPVFTVALLLEYFGEMNFSDVVKKLFLVVVFMGGFYTFHTEGTKIALESANYTLKRVSPTNLFVKRWTQSKVKTKKQDGWDSLKSILIPNVNDLIGTAFFLIAKLFIWLLKLIYSSVFHLTYIFAGVTAILYFLGWTKDALKGTVQASLWCMLMPFVIVAILSLVGNSIEATADNGDLVIAKIDTIIWLFGVTLLLLITPLITYGMIRGDGIHSFGSKMGTMVVSSGIKAMTFYPIMSKMMSLAKNRTLSPFNFNKSIQKRSLNSSKSNLSNSLKNGANTKDTKFKGTKLAPNSINNDSKSKFYSNSSKELKLSSSPVIASKPQVVRKTNTFKSSNVYEKRQGSILKTQSNSLKREKLSEVRSPSLDKVSKREKTVIKRSDNNKNDFRRKR